MEEQGAGWGQDTIGLLHSRAQETEVIVEAIAVDRRFRKCLRTIPVAAKTGAVAGWIAYGSNASAFLSSPCVERGVDVYQVHAGIGQCQERGKIFAVNDAVQELTPK